MSLVYNLELGVGTDFEEVKMWILSFSDFSVLGNEERKISGFFNKTNTHVLLEKIPPRNVFAEGYDGNQFKVDVVIKLGLNKHNEKSSLDIKEVVNKISKSIPFGFVLSFEYENVVAVKKDGEDVVWVGRI